MRTLQLATLGLPRPVALIEPRRPREFGTGRFRGVRGPRSPGLSVLDRTLRTRSSVPPILKDRMTTIPENEALKAWVAFVAEYTTPNAVHWCDGSEGELAALRQQMVRSGTLIPLDPTVHPDSFLHRSDPSDVARTEHLTFLATGSPDDAGPTNNWMSIEEAKARVWPLFKGCMKGRTMYVVPYLLGPPGSSFSRVGVELTDSPYVVANLRIMTRMGRVALQQLGRSIDYVKGMHSLADLSPERRFIRSSTKREIGAMASTSARRW